MKPSLHTRHSALDWALLVGLAIIWGTSFLFTKIAVATIPPATLVTVRVTVAAALLLVLVRAGGLALPPLGSVWGRLVLLAATGNALPFFLISWGQQRVDSSLAGILMAVMPLATLLLAHFFVPGERVSQRRVAGFFLGFLGIVLLLGPEALRQIGGGRSDLVRESAILGGALCYAVNAILARRLPPMHILVSSAGVMMMASAIMVPVTLVQAAPLGDGPTVGSGVAAVWLGLIATGVATVIYFKIIVTAGPTFLSLINYLIPLIAVLAGVALLKEQPAWTAIVALAVILVGLLLGQGRPPGGERQ